MKKRGIRQRGHCTVLDFVLLDNNAHFYLNIIRADPFSPSSDTAVQNQLCAVCSDDKLPILTLRIPYAVGVFAVTTADRSVYVDS